MQWHESKEFYPDQTKRLHKSFGRSGLVSNTDRLCPMNLYLHGVNADPSPVKVEDSLAKDPGDRFSVVTNPPFGQKSSIGTMTEEGNTEKDETTYERQDFVATTKNMQLNILQHLLTLSDVGEWCAIVVPDNMLFEGGAGEKVRPSRMKTCDAHTLR